ncbi:hypothetical protein WSM22_28560 [Cytophagales bacterium WSM2-2]|nr:hypothetical protein WSM22_28560 [Cytophagales bacterium WSM2-2]
MKKIRLCSLILFWCLPSCLLAQSLILDASHKNLEDESLDLKQWAYFNSQLLADRRVWPQNDGRLTIESGLKEIDAGTFVLNVVINSIHKNANLAIEVPVIFSSYQLFVNGQQVGSKGKVGLSVQTCVPEPRPDTYRFKSTGDTIQLVLRVANFYPSTGGIHGPVRLGLASRVLLNNHFIKVMDYALAVVLLIIALVSLSFYYVRVEHRSVFIFQTLFSSAWLIRSLFSNYYRALDWLELSWKMQMRIEYLSVILTTVLAMFFIGSLFPQDFKKYVKTATLILGSAFCISVLVLPPGVFITYLWIYLAFSSLVLLNVLFLIMKAFLNNRGGSTIMLITILLGSITFGYVIITYLGFYEINLMVYNVSFIILWVMLAASVSVRLSKIDRLSETSVLTMEHFFPGTHK